MLNSRLGPSDNVEEENRHSPAQHDGLALDAAVKPHACGMPLARFQGLTAPPRQTENDSYAVIARKNRLLTLSQKSNLAFLNQTTYPQAHHRPPKRGNSSCSCSV
jgi:hypothetical protein